MLLPILTGVKHNEAHLLSWQRLAIPKAGRKFMFTHIPGGSYASTGEIYTCSGLPNMNDPWLSKDIGLTHHHPDGSTSGCFDRLSAWKYAEWHYVD